MPKPIPWAHGVAIGLGLGLALLAFLMVTRGGGCSLDHYSDSDHKNAPPVTGQVSGRVYVVGATVHGLPGVIEVLRPFSNRQVGMKVLSTVTVHESGRFRFALAPGAYQFRVFPLQSRRYGLSISRPFRIRAGQDTKVDVTFAVRGEVKYVSPVRIASRGRTTGLGGSCTRWWRSSYPKD